MLVTLPDDDEPTLPLSKYTFTSEEPSAEYIIRSTTVNPDNIQVEFCTLSADIAYWSQQYADAYEKLSRHVVAMKELEATLLIDYRARLEAVRKPTVAEIEALVASDQSYAAAQRQKVHLECDKVRVSGILEAVRAKKDMLVSLGAQQRAEMGANISVHNNGNY